MLFAIPKTPRMGVSPCGSAGILDRELKTSCNAYHTTPAVFLFLIGDTPMSLQERSPAGECDNLRRDVDESRTESNLHLTINLKEC